MNFDDREIDDEKLMSEIDKLDTDYAINSSESKKPKKKLKINKNLFFIVLLAVVLFSYACYESVLNKDRLAVDEQSYEEQENAKIREEKAFEECKKNVVIIAKNINSYNALIVNIKNNNDLPLNNFYVYAIFYDENDKPIKVARKDVYYVGPNSEIYVEFEKIDIKYTSIDFVIEKDNFYHESENFENKVVFETYQKDGNIRIKGKNVSGSKIEGIQFQVVYFDENENVLGTKSSYEFDIKKNGTFDIKCYKSYNSDYEEIEYSSYKVILVDVY